MQVVFARRRSLPLTVNPFNKWELRQKDETPEDAKVVLLLWYTEPVRNKIKVVILGSKTLRLTNGVPILTTRRLHKPRRGRWDGFV